MFVVELGAEHFAHIVHRVHLLHLVDYALFALEVEIADDESLESASVEVDCGLTRPVLLIQLLFVDQSEQKQVEHSFDGQGPAQIAAHLIGEEKRLFEAHVEAGTDPVG